MELSLGAVLSYGMGLLLLFLLGWLLLKPIKWALKLLVNALIGGAALILLNLAGGPFGISIAVNPLNALIVGVLGLPGVILLLVLKMIL